MCVFLVSSSSSSFALFNWIVSQPASQPTVLFSNTKSAAARQKYFSLTTNQYQLSATASQTER
jgi:hypothetical protein